MYLWDREFGKTSSLELPANVRHKCLHTVMKTPSKKRDENRWNYWDSVDPSLIDVKVNFQILAYVQVLRM